MEEVTIFKTIHPEEVYSVPPPVTIVIGVPWSELKQGHRELLSKILLAVKHSIDSVRIVHQSMLDLSAWVEKPTHLIAFLSPPKGLAPYEVIQADETSLVISDPFEILIEDEAAKRKLWVALKALFPG